MKINSNKNVDLKLKEGVEYCCYEGIVGLPCVFDMSYDIMDDYFYDVSGDCDFACNIKRREECAYWQKRK